MSLDRWRCSLFVMLYHSKRAPTPQQSLIVLIRYWLMPKVSRTFVPSAEVGGEYVALEDVLQAVGDSIVRDDRVLVTRDRPEA